MPHSCSCQWVTLCDKLAKMKLWEHWHCHSLYEPWVVTPSLLLQIWCLRPATGLCAQRILSRGPPCCPRGSARDPPCCYMGQPETRPLLPTWVSWETHPLLHRRSAETHPAARVGQLGPTPAAPWVSRRPTPAAHVGPVRAYPYCPRQPETYPAAHGSAGDPPLPHRVSWEPTPCSPVGQLETHPLLPSARDLPCCLPGSAGDLPCCPRGSAMLFHRKCLSVPFSQAKT